MIVNSSRNLQEHSFEALVQYRMSTIMCTLKEDHCLSSMGESHFLFMLICLDT